VKNRSKKILLLFILIALVIFLSKKILLYFSIWLLGVCIYKLKGLGKISRTILIFSLPLILIIIRYPFGFLKNAEMEIIKDLILGIYLMLLLSSLKYIKPYWWLTKKVHTRLADFSYTLYLVHFPILILISSVINLLLHVSFLNQPSYGTFIYFFSLIAVLYASSFALAEITEARTKILRNKLMTIFRIN
jgi:peptidoglycan/LPS O-acetylase OafA/YrhL